MLLHSLARVFIFTLCLSSLVTSLLSDSWRTVSVRGNTWLTAITTSAWSLECPSKLSEHLMDQAGCLDSTIGLKPYSLRDLLAQ